MTLPVDGWGVYESVRTLGDPTALPRLDIIASLKFQLVLNYALLFGHITDVTAYINYAASKGLKVIVALNDPAIWNYTAVSPNYVTKYPQLYTDSGNAATETAFAQYVVNQVKS